MTNILIGNLIAFIASLLTVYAGVLKNKNEIIYVNSIEKVLCVISNIVLRGITGAVTNSIALVRNILCYRNKLFSKEKILIIIATLVLSLSFNNLGLIGFLPMIGTIIYTLFMNTKDIIKFKFLSIFSTTLYLIYNAYILAYAAVIIQGLQITANIFSIYKLVKEKKKNNIREEYNGRN